ncbi:MAG: 5-formyltetrahydrofolate cyclo-ligase [Proteobacteria bacterium]|nr:5-formyltetrahydrofolate cyclo-ligase [Pseudomonadota bacterium]
MASRLRQQLRKSRQSLTSKQRNQMSAVITGELARYRPFQRARRVAFYYPTEEEVDTRPAMTMAAETGKEIYLPVINTARWRQATLLFQRYQPGQSELKANRFGIPEPVHRPGESIRGQEMDLVCVPLVGFNAACDRIGMGGGYYDRAFATPSWRGTWLLGLAFSCQQAEFEPRPHDVRLNVVLTEKGIINRKSTA